MPAAKRSYFAQLTLFPRWSRSIWITAWEQRKFSDLVLIERGGSPRPIDAYITEDPAGLNWVKIGDAPSMGRYITTTSEKIKPEGLSKTRQVYPGDLVLSNSMSFGRPYIMAVEGCIHDGWLLIRDTQNQFDPVFLCHMLGTPQMLDQYRMFASGSTVNNLNKELVGNAMVPLPDRDEQVKIGNYLDELDGLITLHQRKCQYRGLYGYLSWEQRKLGNCGTTYGGLSGKTKEDFGHGNARFIPYTNVFDNPLTDTKRLETVEIDSSQNKVAYGDTFFTVSSETPDEVGMSSVWLSDQDDVYLNSFCFGYRQDSTFDPHYLAYMLRSSSIRSDLTLLAQGISRFNISKNKVMELSVPVPSAVEQEQLGQYFTKLDSLITLHQ